MPPPRACGGVAGAVIMAAVMNRETALWMPRHEADTGVNVWGLPRGVNAMRQRDVESAQRARLFYAMTECVAKHGYAATAVADVLAVAKISRRAFYGLFRDKEACYLALYQRGHEALVAAVMAAQQGVTTWREHLERSHRAYLAFFVRYPKLANTLLVEAAAAGPAALRARDRYHAEFTRYQRNLYEMRRSEEPGLPRLPDEVFAVLIDGIDALVARWVREGRASKLLELEPAVLYAVSSVHGGEPLYAVPFQQRVRGSLSRR